MEFEVAMINEVFDLSRAEARMSSVWHCNIFHLPAECGGLANLIGACAPRLWVVQINGKNMDIIMR